MSSYENYLIFYVATGCYFASLLIYLFRQQKISLFFFFIGFSFHTLFQISRGWIIGIFTPDAIFTEIYFLPWCLACLGLGLKWVKKEVKLSHSVLIPILFFLLLALFFPRGILPPSPQHQTIFCPLFLFFEVLAHACFALGAWFAFLYLQGKEKAQIFHSFIIWGFIFYSIAQVVGAIWCYLGWASLFSWGDRHLQSASLWCYYAAYLHLRFLPTFNIKKKAWLALVGFVLIFVFIYPNYFIEMTTHPLLGG